MSFSKFSCFLQISFHMTEHVNLCLIAGTPPTDLNKKCVYVSHESGEPAWRNVHCDGIHNNNGVISGLHPLCTYETNGKIGISSLQSNLRIDYG